MMPGFGELMRAESLKFVPTAILSRQTAGLRGSSLIVNLPGKPKSIRECLDAVFPAIPYCIDLMEGPYLECDETVIKPFRPKNKKAGRGLPRPCLFAAVYLDPGLAPSELPYTSIRLMQSRLPRISTPTPDPLSDPCRNRGSCCDRCHKTP